MVTKASASDDREKEKKAGEQSPKFLHDIIDILASCLPNNEQITIPEESHELGRMEKPEVFNMRALEFLSKHS